MKNGEIVELGRHRLMCGDCTIQDNILKLFDGKKAQMIFTDPPFNVAYKGKRFCKRKEIQNDNLSEEDFKNLIDNAFRNAAEVSDKGCMVYVAMASATFSVLKDIMKKNNYHWSTTIIWAKNSFVVSWADYHNQYEPLWYGWLKGANRLHPLTDRKQSNLWMIKRPFISKLHPTQKPVDLVARAIQNSTNEGDIILDMFGGSGTTLEAAERTGRTCYIIEIDGDYCDSIIQRYKDIIKDC